MRTMRSSPSFFRLSRYRFLWMVGLAFCYRSYQIATFVRRLAVEDDFHDNNYGTARKTTTQFFQGKAARLEESLQPLEQTTELEQDTSVEAQKPPTANNDTGTVELVLQSMKQPHQDIDPARNEQREDTEQLNQQENQPQQQQQQIQHQEEQYEVTRGKAYDPQKAASLFTIIADPRAGSEYVMNRLNRHESICASGDFPTAALLPNTMPWLSNDSIEKGCTLAFIREGIIELTGEAPDQDRTSWTPSRCEPQFDSSNDLLRNHLERFCAFVQKLKGDFSNQAITNVFLDSYLENSKIVTGCSCSETATVKGIKVAADWIGNNKMPLETTVVTGSKVIRLTKKNMFERYMSFKTAEKSEQWTIRTEKDKVTQMGAFKKFNYVVDVDSMLATFRWMQETDGKVDAWVDEHGGEILWIDYDQVRDHPERVFSKIVSFLGFTESNDVLNIARLLHLDEGGSLATYNGKTLLDYIANRDEVLEALGANGFGSFIGLANYQPLQHVVFADKYFVPSSLNGLNVTILSNNGPNTTGPAAKFSAALSVLTKMSPTSLVVLSDGGHGALNHHIRRLSTLYTEIQKVRVAVAEMKRQYPGAVLMSASTECCSNALAHVEPGALFHDNGRRSMRTCKNGECESLSFEVDKTDSWKNFMKNRASSKNLQNSDSMYLDASFIAGTAGDLLRLIEAIDINPSEDDRAVLTDYMYRNPDKIVLDYEHKLFGSRFDGVISKIGFNCDADKSINSGRFAMATSSPLFLHSSRESKCQFNSTAKHFPAWDNKGIAVKPILNHIDNFLTKGVSMRGIDRHFDKEILYIMDSKGLWASEVKRDIYRVKPTEQFLTMAHGELIGQTTSDESSQRWRALQRTIQSVGFPYWAWYGDWKKCNYQNAGEDSIPLFTTCASTACTHSFPTPTYMNIIDSQPDTGHWYNIFRQFDKDYPWESKIRKVVWRGALSENNPKKVFSSSRWRLCKFVHQLSNTEQKDMFDVGLTNIPRFLTAQIEIDASVVGGLVPGIASMNDFQKYAAILDMDGNSWSSRFGTLLCYNSVAIKVEPAYADYFLHDLVPWKHYIPVKDDLSDLIENIAFVLDPENDNIVREIIASANQWCSERFTNKGLTYSMFDTWESYIQLLDRADPNWTKEWEQKKADLFSSSSEIALVQLK